MNVAIIENGAVKNIVVGESVNQISAVLGIAAANLLNVDGISCRIGQAYTGGALVPDPVPDPVTPPTPTITVSPVEFKLLWSPAERVTIKGMRATDPVIDDFYDIVDDPRLTFVNLSLQSTQDAVDYLLAALVAATVLTTDTAATRRTAILSGVFQ